MDDDATAPRKDKLSDIDGRPSGPADDESKDVGGGKPSGPSDDPLVWIDLELTGLEAHDQILEVACILTTHALDPLPHDPPPFHAIVQCPRSRLGEMGPVCTAMHARSGLSDLCATSASAVTLPVAAAGLGAYLAENLPAGLPPRRALLAGSSVHADRVALARHAEFRPVLDLLHYRILDVSAIKEAARRWCSEGVIMATPPKVGAHRALDDIRESIAEARYYRDVIFRPARLPGYRERATVLLRGGGPLLRIGGPSGGGIRPWLEALVRRGLRR